MRYRDVGVLVYDKVKATPGYTLVVPQSSTKAYLIGMRGEVLHEWSFPLCPGNYAYLLPNGNLLWAGRMDEGPPLRRGKGGLLREYNWDGEVVWEYCDPAQHHDFRRRPDGNTIYIGWEPVPADVAPRIKGGQPGSEHEGLTYGDYVREISPAGDTVWEWHAWRDLDLDRWEICHCCGRDEFAHANACFPLDDGGVMLSFRRLNAIMMIDRETCKTRWAHQDVTWGHQHDCTVLPNGNILLFANGVHCLDNPHSRVIELDPKSGETVWHYKGSPIWTFFSPNISGAQRFDNGNTLVCEGQMGRAFEVTQAGEIVWEYVCPFFADYEGRGPANSMFRVYRYAADSPEIGGRLASPVAW
jgi:hypothetical protein